MSPEAQARPRATIAMEKGGLRLAALNRAARALGLAPGLPLADARARHPALDVSDADPAADQRLLEDIADACERYTPLLALQPPDGLLLDISGCAHLFGGEAGLLRDLRRRVRQEGYGARAAIAATPGAATALARFGETPAIIVPAEEDLASVLAPLPLAGLCLPPATLTALARLGFACIGDLLHKPRAPLTARFGTALLLRLDQATGQAREALVHRFPPPRFSAEKALFEPIQQEEDVLGLAAHLAQSLAPALEGHGLGARRLELSLFRVDGKVTRLRIGTGRPVRDPQMVRRLFAEKIAALESLDAGFGFDLLRLCVTETDTLAPHQQDFEARTTAADAAVEMLVDRLSARLGARRVERLLAVDNHLPEDAVRRVPAQSQRGRPFDTAQANDPYADDFFAPAASPASPERACEGAAQVLAFPAPARRGDAPSDAGPLDASPDRDGPQASELATGPTTPAKTQAQGIRMEEIEVREIKVRDIKAREAEARPLHIHGYGFSRGRNASREDAAHAHAPRKTASARGPGAPVARHAGTGTARAASPSPYAPDAEPRPLDSRAPTRPLRLFERPEPVEAVAEVPDGAPLRFRWRHLTHMVARAEGPERIAAPWWRTEGLAPTRDYFRVETTDGRRFWLFRAGLFGTEMQYPQWFLHGVFG